jgi:hypothetical protein
MTKEEFIGNWLYNLDDKEDAMKMMADLDKVINSQFEKSDEKINVFLVNILRLLSVDEMKILVNSINARL